jgi:hypothetical protein
MVRVFEYGMPLDIISACLEQRFERNVEPFRVLRVCGGGTSLDAIAARSLISRPENLAVTFEQKQFV